MLTLIIDIGETVELRLRSQKLGCRLKATNQGLWPVDQNGWELCFKPVINKAGVMAGCRLHRNHDGPCERING